MRKFMIVQLGLILALASSNAFAAAEAPKPEGKARVEDGVAGDHREDAATAEAHRAGTAASARAAKAVKSANRQSEDSVKTDSSHLPPKGHPDRTPEMIAESTNIQILRLASQGKLGSYSKTCADILNNRNDGRTEIERLKAVSDATGKSVADLTLKCEE